METPGPDPTGIPPSKSQRKRDAHALFELGRELVEMPPKALAALPLEDDLLREVNFARGIRSHVARKRHLQFIAKMLRKRDVEALRGALEAARQEARQLTVRHHRAETWRDLLLADGDRLLSDLLSEYGSDDAQVLRQLIRNARREAQGGKPPASARKLFRHLRDLDAIKPLPPTPGSD